MTDPKPTRFRFSLRFLLTWVLLSNLFLFASFAYTRRQRVEFPDPWTYREGEPYCYSTTQGWPCTAYATFEKFYGMPEKNEREYYSSGLILNVLSSAAGALTICYFFRLLIAKLSKHD